MSSYPSHLWLVRHGQSAGNVALDDAEKRGLSTIEISGRDVDVPLSPLGEQQARCVGAWFRERAEDERFTMVLSSPYARARQTARLVVESSNSSTRIAADERLREKEFGSLNRLTKKGILAAYPDEAKRRDALGKFYYRPPGGESWCDVLLRLRSVVDDIQLRYSGERVLLVVHQVIVLCFRYVLEEMDEAALLEVDRGGDVANCAITAYELAKGADGRAKMALRSYNTVAHLSAAGAGITRTPDPAVKK